MRTEQVGSRPSEEALEGTAAAAEGSAAKAPSQRQRPSGGRWTLRNWRVRSRLVALLAIPTLAALLLGSFQLYGGITRVGTYDVLLGKADFDKALVNLVHEMTLERDLAARFIGGDRKSPDELKAQFGKADAARKVVIGKADSIKGLLTPLDAGQVQGIVIRLAEVEPTRQGVLKSAMPALAVVKKYTQIVAVLQQFHDRLTQDSEDETLNEQVRAFAAMTRAKEHASRQRGILAAALERGNWRPGELDAFRAANAQQVSEIANFNAVATVDDVQLFEDTVTGRKVDRAELYRLRAQEQGLTRKDQVLDIGVARGKAPGAWFDAISGTVGQDTGPTEADGMRRVELNLAGSIADRISVLRGGAQGDALLYGAFIVLLLLVVLAVTAVIARSLTRPLRHLRRGALDVAESALPAAVSALREGPSVRVPQIRPIGVSTRDEIGEVARAFDEVHREALRLAGQESQLRANVNAMFVNLSRRSQTLVERQLRIIDSLEQGEQDAKRLENFFKLDHLATRMRRNSENLLVLAGQDQPRRWGQPIPMVDVLRAAVSEVEQYQRISMRLQPGITVIGQAVNDVVHLVAELTENATMYSPENTPVVIAGHPLGGTNGDVMITISDNGIGMVPDELADANRRLSEPQAIDVSVSRRMGLFVVSRLASRHGIRVQLRPSQVTGITALILLPAAIVAPGGGEQPPLEHDSYRSELTAAGTGQGGYAPVAATGPMPAIEQWGPDSRPSPPPPDMPSSPVPMEPTGMGTPAPPEAHGMGTPAPMEVHGMGTPGAMETHAPSPPPPPVVTPGPPAVPYGPPGRNGGAPAPYAPQSSPGPAPQGQPAPQTPAPNGERLPIFDSVESEWFRRTPSGESPVAHVDRTWSSPADEGWSAAQAASTPQGGGQTSSGLPKRVPKANLVPGSVSPVSSFGRAEGTGVHVAQETPPDTAGSPVTPDVVRTRLSGLQRGVRRARGDMGAGAAPHDQRENS